MSSDVSETLNGAKILRLRSVLQVVFFSLASASLGSSKGKESLRVTRRDPQTNTAIRSLRPFTVARFALLNLTPLRFSQFYRSGCESWLEDSSNVDPKCPNEGIGIVGGFLPIEQLPATG